MGVAAILVVEGEDQIPGVEEEEGAMTIGILTLEIWEWMILIDLQSQNRRIGRTRETLLRE